MHRAVLIVLVVLAMRPSAVLAQRDTIWSPFVTEPTLIQDWSTRSLDPVDSVMVMPWFWCRRFPCWYCYLYEYHGPIYSVGYSNDGMRNFLEFGGGYYFSGPELIVSEETRTDLQGRWDLGVNALFNTLYLPVVRGLFKQPFLRAGPTLGFDLWEGRSRPYVKGTVALLGPLFRVNIGAGYKWALTEVDMPALREGFSFDLVLYLLPPRRLQP